MTRDFVVGLFFLGFLTLLGVLTMKTGAFRDEHHQYNIFFDRISGLTRGDEVRLRGARIGEVEKIGLPSDEGVSVDIRVAQPLELRKGAVFRVSALGALGGNYLDYVPGKGEKDPNLALKGTSSVDLMSAIGDLVEENREKVTNFINGLEEATNNIHEGKGLLGRLLNDAGLSAQVDEIVDNIRSISAKIDAGEGALGTLINDEEISEGLRRIPDILDDLERVADQLAATEGPLGVLINDPEAGEAVRQMLADVRAKKGLLGRLIGDETLGVQFEELIADLAAVAREVRAGEGILPRLIHDEQLAYDLEEFLINAQQISDKINRGEGTFGKLVNDDALVRDTRAAMISLRDTTEDAREQAPINAFFNALFSIF